MAASGALVLRASGLRALARIHAACLCAYGVRLNAFLLWRELTVPRFAEFRETVEAACPYPWEEDVDWFVYVRGQR